MRVTSSSKKGLFSRRGGGAAAAARGRENNSGGGGGGAANGQGGPPGAPGRARGRDGSSGGLGPAPPVLTQPRGAAARFRIRAPHRPRRARGTEQRRWRPGPRRCPDEGTVPQTARRSLWRV